MATTEIFGLQWLEHSRIFNQAIVELRSKSAFTDATLACEGKFYPVHKFVLSTCSDYFSAIFEWTPCVNPVVVINNISQHHLESLLDFMYRGETSIQECYIQDVMKAAECLHIKGLSVRQDDINFAKNKINSAEDFDEPKKKRRKSETIKKPFMKPQLQAENSYGQQVSSPIQSSISSTRPTPTPPPPPTTPIQHSSPHHTPPIHSPSLHSASPHALSSSTSSPVSQSQFPITHPVPSPKPLVSPLPPFTTQKQQVRNVPQFMETPAANTTLQIQATAHQYVSYSTQPTDHFPCVKDEQTSVVYSSLSNLVPGNSSSSSIISVSQEAPQYRKYSPSIQPDKIQRLKQDEIRRAIAPVLPQVLPVDQKIMGIGQEIHLEGPVKELQIATEDGGTVSLPEILEDWVEMRQLYESKQNEAYSRESKPAVMEMLPQCSTSGSVEVLYPYKEECSENMYEFREEFQEEGMENIRIMKEKNVKVYSNNGPVSRKKNSSSSSSLQVDPTASSSDMSNASTGPSPTPTPSRERTEDKGAFACSMCERSYKKRESLTRHIRTHSEFPYTCTECQFKCKAYKEYLLHRKTHATKRCDKCDFVTIRTDALRRHMKSSHSEERTHKCPYADCAFSSSRGDLLASHIQTNHAKKEENESRVGQ